MAMRAGRVRWERSQRDVASATLGVTKGKSTKKHRGSVCAQL